MAYNQLAGPQVGQIVVYTENSDYFYPALITAVAQITGLVELTTFPPGLGTVDQVSVRCDPDGLASGTWRHLNEIGEGTSSLVDTIFFRTESGSIILTEDGVKGLVDEASR